MHPSVEAASWISTKATIQDRRSASRTASALERESSNPNRVGRPTLLVPALYRLPEDSLTTSIAKQAFDKLGRPSSPYERDWFIYVPARLDHYPALAHATQAVVCAIRRPPWKAADFISYGAGSYIEAIKCLRGARMDSEAALLSIIMLVVYEMHTGGNNMQAFQSHLSGISSVLLAYPEKWVTSEVASSVLYSCRMAVCERYILRGLPSPFDRHPWRDLELPGDICPQTRQLMKIALRILLKVPRLVQNLRYLRAESGIRSESERATIAQNLSSLLEATFRDEFDTSGEVFNRLVKSGTLSDLDRSIIPLSFEFDDYRDLHALVEYCRARLLVLNIYHQLVALDVGATEHLQLPLDSRKERNQMVDWILMAWQGCRQANRLNRGLTIALFPVWGALREFVEYRGHPIKDVLAWLEVKCVIANNHWTGFRGAEDMEATCDMYVGGDPTHAVFNRSNK